jgi:hypothetical protein
MNKKAPAPETAIPADEEAERILICAKLVGFIYQRRVMVAGDPWSPDKGPLHTYYEGTYSKRDKLIQRLMTLGIPTTDGGNRALAHLAVAAADRTHKGAIIATHADLWVALAAAQGLAGTAVPMVTAEEHYSREDRELIFGSPPETGA